MELGLSRKMLNERVCELGVSCVPCSGTLSFLRTQVASVLCGFADSAAFRRFHFDLALCRCSPVIKLNHRVRSATLLAQRWPDSLSGSAAAQFVAILRESPMF